MKIVLIGFMGAGKTTLGKLLAKKLNYTYVDTDRQIVTLSGRSSDREIFDLDGEKIFRELETVVAKNLENDKNVIISTGGGIVMNKINMDYLKSNGIIVYLRNTFNSSLNRISKKNPPPLFRDLKRAKELFDLRYPIYNNYANITIDTDNKQIDMISEEIIKSLNSYENYS